MPFIRLYDPLIQLGCNIQTVLGAHPFFCYCTHGDKALWKYQEKEMNYAESKLRDDRDSTLKMRAIPAHTKLSWQEYAPFPVLGILIVCILVILT